MYNVDNVKALKKIYGRKYDNHYIVEGHMPSVVPYEYVLKKITFDNTEPENDPRIHFQNNEIITQGYCFYVDPLHPDDEYIIPIWTYGNCFHFKCIALSGTTILIREGNEVHFGIQIIQNQLFINYKNMVKTIELINPFTVKVKNNILYLQDEEIDNINLPKEFNFVVCTSLYPVEIWNLGCDNQSGNKNQMMSEQLTWTQEEIVLNPSSRYFPNDFNNPNMGKYLSI
jgi:hypothetical protein